MEGILVPWMLVHYGWRASFTVVGFAALLWLVPWLAATPRDLRDPTAAQRARHPGFGAAVAALVTNRNLLGICIGFFCFDYYWYFLVNWLPDYLVTARGLTIVKAGINAALPYFVFGVSEPIGGWLADHLVRRGWSETRARKGVVTVAFLTGLLLIPAARIDSPSAAVALIVGGCFVGLATGNLLVILQSCAPRDEIGLWTGVYNFVGNIAGILSPLITGFLIEKTGSYTPPFVLAAGLIALGPLAFWTVVGELKAAESAEAA
jgi:MFS transporter, ACS family, D-galactonate transporter